MSEKQTRLSNGDKKDPKKKEKTSSFDRSFDMTYTCILKGEADLNDNRYHKV